MLAIVAFTGAPSSRAQGTPTYTWRNNFYRGVRGVYRSDNAGATWLRINDDQHQYGWTEGAITGDPRVYGRGYLGTKGRRIIYGEPGS